MTILKHKYLVNRALRSNFIVFEAQGTSKEQATTMAMSPSPSYTGSLNIDPSSFDASVYSLLICLDGEKYIDIFRSRNISQETLMELTDDDLRRLGIDDANVRAGLIKEVKNFPMYEELLNRRKLTSDLDLTEIANMLRDSNQHIHRVHLSMISINLALRRRSYPDVIIGNKPVTSILMTTLDEISNTLTKMENALQTKFQCLDENYESMRRKKILVGTVGSAVIAVLGIYFMRSLKNAGLLVK